jgi:hypothetical protein
VVLLVAAAAIFLGMLAAAAGRGGEMAEFSADVRPLDGNIHTAADVALLRPPGALWGYDKRSTDEALNLVARTITERDVEIATLQRQIADMRSASEHPFAAEADATTGPRGIVDIGAIWEPGAQPRARGGPGVAEPGSHAAPFVRRQASPAPPPAGTQPWSAWEKPAPAGWPDQSEPAEPGEPG